MFSFKKASMQKLCKWKACSTFPVLERKGAHLIYQMGESRILYVGIRESRRMLHISFIKILRFPTQISILKSQFSGLSFKFEAGWDAEVVSTIEKTPGTVYRQYIPGFFIWVGQDRIHINQEISR